VGPRAVLDAVVKRRIPNPRRESNPRTPIVQPVAQRTVTFKCVYYIFYYINIKMRIRRTDTESSLGE
jgi:hypothetical protein